MRIVRIMVKVTFRCKSPRLIGSKTGVRAKPGSEWVFVSKTHSDPGFASALIRFYP